MKSNNPETELNFPVFTEAPREHRQPLSWETVMTESHSFREYYRAHYDSPGRRLAGKNPRPFRLE